MSIQNISRSKISLVATLANRKFRRKEGLFVVEGRKCVADTIGKYQLEFIAAKPEWIEYHNIGQTVPEEKVFLTDDDEMKKMSTLVTPSDVLAVYRLPQSTPISEILETPLEPGFYLMPDSIQDPGNLGTIIRTAHWFGMKRIFASPMTADIYNPKAIQSSMGSMASVNVDYVDLPLLVEHHKHLPVIGLDLYGRDIFTSALPDCGFIVLGNEGNGMSPGLREKINMRLTIPPADPANHPESLNVAVAGSITLAMLHSKLPTSNH